MPALLGTPAASTTSPPWRPRSMGSSSWPMSSISSPRVHESPLTSTMFSDKTTIDQYAAAVPAAKVILGVPYFGVDWPTTDGTLTAQATGTSHPRLLPSDHGQRPPHLLGRRPRHRLDLLSGGGPVARDVLRRSDFPLRRGQLAGPATRRPRGLGTRDGRQRSVPVDGAPRTRSRRRG